MDRIDIGSVVEVGLLKWVLSRQDGYRHKKKAHQSLLRERCALYCIHKVEKELFLFI